MNRKTKTTIVDIEIERERTKEKKNTPKILVKLSLLNESKNIQQNLWFTSDLHLYRECMFVCESNRRENKRQRRDRVRERDTERERETHTDTPKNRKMKSNLYVFGMP